MEWHDQYRRVKRYLGRIQNHPRHLNVNEVEYEDFVWAYFQNCWHLKDWVKNDPSVDPKQEKEIERLVDRGEAVNADALKVCSDLANRTKHLVLDRPRVSAIAKNREFQMNVVQGGGSNATANRPDTWDFIVDYETKDPTTGSRRSYRKSALAVAREALDNWHSILADVGLCLPTDRL
jgi:hypothetical protein